MIHIGRVPEIVRGDVVYRVRIALYDYPDLPLRWGMTADVVGERLWEIVFPEDSRFPPGPDIIAAVGRFCRPDLIHNHYVGA